MSPLEWGWSGPAHDLTVPEAPELFATHPYRMARRKPRRIPDGPASRRTLRRLLLAPNGAPLHRRCDEPLMGPDGSILAAGQGQQTTNVVRVDPETLKITELINQPNTESFESGTVAIPIGNDLWIGSFRGDRIAIFPASK